MWGEQCKILGLSSEQFFKELSKVQRNQQVIRNHLITLYVLRAVNNRKKDVKSIITVLVSSKYMQSNVRAISNITYETQVEDSV